MSVLYHPFDSGAGASVYEAQWRKMAEHWLATGVLGGELNQFKVTADGTGMTVDVETGRAWLKGHYVESDAIEALSIDAADPANPRIDRVILRATYSQPGTPGSVALAVLKGVPAGSPSAPALTQDATMWEISLAQVLIDAAAVVVAADKVTSERVFVWAGGDVAVLDRVTSTTTVYNTTDETTVYSEAISAGLLGANGGLQMRLGGSLFQDANPSATFTLRIKFGATTLISIVHTINDYGTTDYYWQLDVLLQNTAAAAQRALASWLVLAAGATDNAVRVAAGVAAEDTANEKTLTVTIQFSAGSTLQEFEVWQGVLELIRPTA